MPIGVLNNTLGSPPPPMGTVPTPTWGVVGVGVEGGAPEGVGRGAAGGAVDVAEGAKDVAEGAVDVVGGAADVAGGAADVAEGAGTDVAGGAATDGVWGP